MIQEFTLRELKNKLELLIKKDLFFASEPAKTEENLSLTTAGKIAINLLRKALNTPFDSPKTRKEAESIVEGIDVFLDVRE